MQVLHGFRTRGSSEQRICRGLIGRRDTPCAIAFGHPTVRTAGSAETALSVPRQKSGEPEKVDGVGGWTVMVLPFVSRQGGREVGRAVRRQGARDHQYAGMGPAHFEEPHGQENGVVAIPRHEATTLGSRQLQLLLTDDTIPSSRRLSAPVAPHS